MAKTHEDGWYIRENINEYGDAEQVHACDYSKLEEMLTWVGDNYSIELRRRYYPDSNLGYGDAYAQGIETELGEEFDDGRKVPKRYREEYRRAVEKGLPDGFVRA